MLADRFIDMEPHDLAALCARHTRNITTRQWPNGHPMDDHDVTVLAEAIATALETLTRKLDPERITR